MKKVYLIELGGKKEMYEMDSLELPHTIDSAIDWIQGNMEDDSQYFNINIKCTMYSDYDKDDNNLKHQYCNVLVYIEADSIVTEEMFASQKYSVETIIENNLSVISKIIAKGEITEVSD